MTTSNGEVLSRFLKRSRAIVIAAGLMIVYIFAGKMGLKFAVVSPSASAVWAPTGIALTAFLFLGYRIWPAIFLGAFIVNITTAGTIATSIGIAGGNTLEGLIGAYLVGRFAGGVRAFHRPQDILKFAMVAGFLSTAVSATVGVTTLCLGGAAPWRDYHPIWLTWWLGDLGGDLVLAPFFILWLQDWRVRWKQRDFIEWVCVLLLLFFIGVVLFGRSLLGAEHYPLGFINVPILFWVAYRYGQREVATAVLFVAAIATWGTLHGLGPFIHGNPNLNLLLLQGFLGVNSILTLAFAAVVSEYKSTFVELQTAHDQLEVRVKERTEQLEGVNASLVDEITERMRAQESAHRLVAIIESSGDAIIGTTLEGIITSWNPGAVALFGYSEQDALGRPLFFLAPPGFEGQVAQSIETVKRGGTEYYETKRLKKGGGVIDVSLTASPVRDETGNIVGSSRIEHDITERMQAEEGLRLKTEELSRSNAELSLFASVVSHELQEPVRKILSFGDLLKEPGTTQEKNREEYICKMQDAAKRMQRLIDDLLALARVTTNTKPMEPSDLNEIVKEVAEDFKARIEHEGGKIKAERLPSIMADDLQMRQLFQNLVSNAFKFRKKDVPLLISISSRTRRNGFVEIEVKDNGIGFEQQYADRIFKPFQRLHRRGEYEGSGMGLAICERILMRHGGVIIARSELGKGSVFVVTLPAMEEPAKKTSSRRS